ncbi:hypothetical protein F4679DRAFT_223 [Xylaria curta]|nr:hypothetical protein F4679DRAFT_223 [Xylaria curta]
MATVMLSQSIILLVTACASHIDSYCSSLPFFLHFPTRTHSTFPLTSIITYTKMPSSHALPANDKKALVNNLFPMIYALTQEHKTVVQLPHAIKPSEGPSIEIVGTRCRKFMSLPDEKRKLLQVPTGNLLQCQVRTILVGGLMMLLWPVVRLLKKIIQYGGIVK